MQVQIQPPWYPPPHARNVQLGSGSCMNYQVLNSDIYKLDLTLQKIKFNMDIVLAFNTTLIVKTLCLINMGTWEHKNISGVLSLHNLLMELYCLYETYNITYLFNLV